MLSHLLPLLGICFSSSLLLPADAPPRVDLTVSAKHLPAQGTSLVVAGVAKVNNGAVTCWTIGGTRSAQVEQDLKITLQMRAKNNEQADWSKPGKKTRIIILRNFQRWSSKSAVEVEQGAGFELEPEFQMSLNGSFSRVSYNIAGPRYLAVPIVVDEQVTQVDLTCSEVVPQSPAQTIRFEVGKSTTTGGIQSTIRSITPYTLVGREKPMFDDNGKGKHWLLTIDTSTPAPRNYLEFTWLPVSEDFEGYWVGLDGQRVPPKKMAKILGRYNGGSDGNGLTREGYFELTFRETFQPNTIVTDEKRQVRTFITNFELKPEYKLRVVAYAPKFIKITGVPLFD